MTRQAAVADPQCGSGVTRYAAAASIVRLGADDGGRNIRRAEGAGP